MGTYVHRFTQELANAMNVGTLLVPVHHHARVTLPRLALVLFLAGPMLASNLALQISSETVPPGGWAQIKVSSATPQLVTAGRIVMKFDPAVFGNILAVAVFSPQGDATGFAAVSGQSLDAQFYSVAGGIGQLSHLPILTVTIPVLTSTPIGTVTAITLDASQGRWTDLQNNSYLVTVTPGSVTVGSSLSVKNVVPGGGVQPAGTVVRIDGTGFGATTAATIDGVSVSSAQFVGTGEIDFTLGGPAELTGKRVVLSNPDGSKVEYFVAMPSAPDQAPASFAGIHPLLSTQTWTSAETRFSRSDYGGYIVLQNPNATAVDAIVQGDGIGTGVGGQTTVTIPPGALNFYSVFGYGYGYRVFSPLPLRVAGLDDGFHGILFTPPTTTLAPVQELVASPAAVSFQWQSGTPMPPPVSVVVDGYGSYFPFQATPPAAPFSVTPTQGASPATLTVSVNPVGLSPGTYTGNLIVTPTGPNAIVTTIPLSLTVSGTALLTTSPQSLIFFGVPNYSFPLNVESNGNPIAFTASADNGERWLTVSPSGGTTPARLAVNVDYSNLNPGVHNRQITITGPNNSVTVPAQVLVFGPPPFSFSPTSVRFSVQTGSSPPPPQSAPVYGISNDVAFTTSTDSGGSWLSVAMTMTGELVSAAISVSPAGLKAGIYTGKVVVASAVPSLPGVLPVTLAIWDKEPVLTVSPSSVIFAVPASTSILTTLPRTQSIQVTSGGVPVHFTVSGWMGVFITPASISVYAANPGKLDTYEYDLTLATSSQTVTVPVTTIATTSDLAPPMIGSVVNAASQVAGSVAPGEILTIYGFGAGPSNTAGFRLDTSGLVATNLNRAQVLFDGRPAPMIYGSAYQANVIVPYELAGQSTTTITLRYSDITSAPWALPVAASVPGIFTFDSTGAGQAAVLNQDNSRNSASNPALRGSVIQIYATGEGQTEPAGVTGSLNGTHSKKPVLQVKVTIGGQDASVQYAGSVENSVAGLLQVNAVVPQTVTPGPAVPVSISVGGVPSQSGATIAVK